MKKYKLSIVNSVIAGILICAILAACGAAEMKRPEVDPPPADKEISAPAHVLPAPEPEAAEPLPENDLSENDPLKTEEQEPVSAEIPEAEAGEENSEPGVLDSEIANKIIETAKAQLGIPFKMGGSSPKEGFDSTGFVYYCLGEAGIDFPRDIKSQLEYGEQVGYSDLAPGDAVYFSAEPGEAAGFCGIYVGGGLIIYSPVPDEFVRTANITTGYWTARFVTGVRPA